MIFIKGMDSLQSVLMIIWVGCMRFDYPTVAIYLERALYYTLHILE
jgi:hypothetical protein